METIVSVVSGVGRVSALNRTRKMYVCVNDTMRGKERNECAREREREKETRICGLMCENCGYSETELRRLIIEML